MERIGDEALRAWRVIESALDSFLQISQGVSVEPRAAWWLDPGWCDDERALRIPR